MQCLSILECSEANEKIARFQVTSGTNGPPCRETHQAYTNQSSDKVTIPNEMHQFDLLYMPSDTLYGSKYKYILAGIDAASRYKISRPLRTKQARDVAEMLADIYKVGPLKYPKIFQCDNGSEFKGDVTKMLEKNEVKI